jgi:sortase (surface protein transpeptidase)
MKTYKHVKKYRVYKDGTIEPIEWQEPSDPRRKAQALKNVKPPGKRKD